MAYDPKCEELARYFLSEDGSEKEIVELARVIQDAVENWWSNRPEAEPEPPEPDREDSI